MCVCCIVEEEEEACLSLFFSITHWIKLIFMFDSEVCFKSYCVCEHVCIHGSIYSSNQSLVIILYMRLVKIPKSTRVCVYTDYGARHCTHGLRLAIARAVLLFLILELC